MKAVLSRDLWKIYVSKVRKLFGSKTHRVEALRGVDLEIENGEIYGILGPNGAGKTTLIKILTTLLLPTKGTAFVGGHDVVREPKKVRSSIGAMLMGERGLFWKLTGRENLELFGKLHGLGGGRLSSRIDYVLELLGIEDIADRLFESYSSGQKMLFTFARAIIHDPPILLLDEPTATMDIRNARKIREIVKELNSEGKTIIYTTHQMHEAEELCDRIAVLDYGRVIAEGTPAELKSMIRGSETVVVIRGIIGPGALDAVLSLDGVKSAEQGEEGGEDFLRVIVEGGSEVLGSIIEALRGRARIHSVEQGVITLEDVFMHLTGRSLSQDTRRGPA